ncbi:MAG TPA: efflux RND transporter permease subunit, partial [Kofleriaceae bacterium]|nr:efflux RND transporter permease subunit [Kofleriaceae bacterium]
MSGPAAQPPNSPPNGPPKEPPKEPPNGPGESGDGEASKGANISAPFIRRPKATWLLAVALLLAGAGAFTQLAVSPLPKVDFPTININAALPGASPTTMATAVAMPLERRFGRIAGVSEITSQSALGTTSVVVQFDMNRDVEGAARDIQAAINAAGGDLPANLPTRPNYRKVNPSDAPILIISLRSKSLPLPTVFEAANTVLAQKLSQVPGVGQVGVGGGVQPAVRVQVDPATLAGLGLGLEDVRTALTNATSNEPKGGVGNAQWQTIGVDDQLLDAAAWKNVIIHWSQPGQSEGPSSSSLAGAAAAAASGAAATGGAGGGVAIGGIVTGGNIATGPAAPQSAALGTAAPAAKGTTDAAASAGTSGASTSVDPNNVGAASGGAGSTPTTSTIARSIDVGGAVRLGDVASVTDDVENRRVAGWFDGERTVMVIIRRQPGANILDVIARIKALLPELTHAISPAIDVEIAIDRAASIRHSVHDVEQSLVISIALVVLVVFIFLRNGRATAIPSVAVPLSLIATFGVMYLLGFSLDNLSLMALTIATGFVVDDAIVVTENVTRHLENGMAPREAALEGAKQIGFTIVSITASLLAVFIPLLFMGGIVGRLFREFAVTLAIAISLSAIISLTLTPMMCSELLRGRTDQPPGWLGRTLDRGLSAIIAGYGRALRFVLSHTLLIGLVTLGTIVTTGWLFTQVPPGLFPQQDTGMIIGASLGPQDISFSAMKSRQEELNGIVLKDPDVSHVVSSIGGFGASTGNQGTMFISLKDKPIRKDSADDVIARLRPKLGRVQGINLFLQSVQDVRVGGRSARTQYQYTLQDADLNELDTWVPKLSSALRKLPELKDVNSDQQNAGLQLTVDIDRDTAARFGITASTIDNTLYDAFGQRQVATFYTQVNQYRVVLEAAPSVGADPSALDRVFVPAASGEQVPLSTFVHPSETTVPLSVSHQGQFPATTIAFNLAPGVALGEATVAIERAATQIGMPASIHGQFAGTAQAFKDSLATQKFLIIIALLTVYIVLGVLYESYMHPITILSTIPSAGLGALLALMLFGSDLNLIAMVGLILLIGIVKKNAILMVDFALELEREGKPPVEAIYQACLLRFRPILMTTMAALLGALPLALGTGTGSELRKPLGIAIVGGLVVSQLLTLFTTPVTYLALHRLA